MRDANEIAKNIKLKKLTSELFCPICDTFEDDEGFNCQCPSTLMANGELEKAIKIADALWAKYKKDKK
jgi:hypothetical protein